MKNEKYNRLEAAQGDDSVTNEHLLAEFDRLYEILNLKA